MTTPYKIFLSVPDIPDAPAYLGAARTALWRMNQMTMSAISASDVALTGEDRILVAKQVMETTALFVGVYGSTYGEAAPGSTQSYAEQEYRLAYQRGILCAIFMHVSARTTTDERMKSLRYFLETHHVINYFATLEELQAQVILAVDTHLHTSRQMRLLPPTQQSFAPALPQAADTLPAIPPNFELLVDEGMRFAADDIEQVVRRALQVWDAEKHVAPSQQADAGSMLVSPLFGPPAGQSQFRSDVFMVMPFREPFNGIYQTVIRPVIGSLNLTIRRGDEFTSVRGVVMNEVWAALNGCRLVIADVTEVNANVFYELGIAHTLGKPTILLTQVVSPEEVPFDIRHLRYIQYQNTIEGGERLAEALRQSMLWILNDITETEEP